MDFTARLEDELDRVESGNIEWQEVVKDFYGPFSKDLDRIENRRAELKRSLQEETDEACEKCGQTMVIKWGRNGRFIACSGFPKCRNTRPLDGEEAQEPTGEVCEKCGAGMIIRTGRNGRFLACSAYPDCKNTRPISLGVRCPREGCNGELVERSSRRGRVFFGCKTYPGCDFASWDRPTGGTCPSCDGPFLAEHTSRNGQTAIRCMKCRHIVRGEAASEEAASEEAASEEVASAS